jgi:hypothetical protein
MHVGVYHFHVAGYNLAKSVWASPFKNTHLEVFFKNCGQFNVYADDPHSFSAAPLFNKTLAQIYRRCSFFL